jgi:hypothetical protein
MMKYLVARFLMILSAMLFGYSIGKGLDAVYQVIFFIFLVCSSLLETSLRD